MSKKNFTGGLSSLLGDQPEKPKRGRPVTQTKEITKSLMIYGSTTFTLELGIKLFLVTQTLFR